MTGRYDRAAVIVTTLGDNGKPLIVQRFLASEMRTCEATILALVKRGKQLRLTFIDRVYDDHVDDDKRAELVALSTSKPKRKRGK